MGKISVIVQTYNASSHLDMVLSSLAGFDEIVVADMESTDDTLEIARRHGARTVVYPRENHRICEAYRDRAIHEATHEWVLVVDADEVVPPGLCRYLYDEIERDSSPHCVLIPRRNYFMGRWMKCDYPDYVPRFMYRDGTNWPNSIHSRPTHRGGEVKLPASREDLSLIHLANETMAQRVAKMNYYTDQEKCRYRVGYRRWKLLTDPLFRFFKCYFLKGGIRLGREGFIRAVMDGFYRFIVVAKLEEERQRLEMTDLDRHLCEIKMNRVDKSEKKES